MWDVVHIITRLELGGAQLATLYEVSHTRFATGHRHLFFGPGGLLDAEAQALPGVIPHAVPALVRAVDPRRDVVAVCDLARRLLRLRRPGARLLVHTHSSKAGIVGRTAARLAGAQLVVHSVHGFGHAHAASRTQRAALRWAERLAGRCTDGFTADSQANIDQGRSERLFAGAPARVVRCGIDVEAIRQAAPSREATRASMGVTAADVVVLNLSCLKPQKDPLTYVRVAARVCINQPRAVFWLAGDGELRPAVERLARELHLGDRFRLLGWRRDVPELLAASDLLALTSLWEGLPQAMPQAMAAGKPIVATRVDGAPEAVQHGRTGLLCAPGDCDGLAQAIAMLVRDPALAGRMGAAGSEAVGPFSRAAMVAALDAFYEELL